MVELAADDNLLALRGGKFLFASFESLKLKQNNGQRTGYSHKTNPSFKLIFHRATGKWVMFIRKKRAATGIAQENTIQR